MLELLIVLRAATLPANLLAALFPSLGTSWLPFGLRLACSPRIPVLILVLSSPLLATTSNRAWWELAWAPLQILKGQSSPPVASSKTCLAAVWVVADHGSQLHERRLRKLRTCSDVTACRIVTRR